MTEDPGVVAEGTPRSAGALLKAAREREGLHLAVLAATIKVAPAKLEALEQDRHADLPNATFARALAQSVCRSLKIDPRPVLALLPQVEMPPLEGAMGKLNTPFQERSNRAEGGVAGGLAWASKPMFLAGGLLLVAAIAVALLPPGWVESWTSASGDTPEAAAPGIASAALPASAVVAQLLPASAAGVAEAVAAPASATPVASAIPAPVPAPAPAATVAPAPAPPAPVASAAAPTPAAAGLLQLQARAPSWVEVLDAQGQTVFSRTLAEGEQVGIDARPPLRVLVGNAGGTTLTFRGQVADLGPYTRNNVARLELR